MPEISHHTISMTSDISSEYQTTTIAECGTPGACIHSIPDEVLVYIFQLYGVAQRSGFPFMLTSWMSVDNRLIDPDTEPRWGHRHLWTPLMLVCRSWRALGVATPSLWRTIDVRRRNIEWLRLSLVRSQTAPIDIFFHDPINVQKAVPFIVPHSHRIRKILLPPLEGHIWIEVGQIQTAAASFLSVLNGNLPILDELMMCLGAMGTVQGIIPPSIDLSGACVPSLQTLRVGYVRLSWAGVLASHLKCVVFYACRALPPPLSPDRFLDALQACHKLEQLELHDKFVSSTLGLTQSPTDVDLGLAVFETHRVVSMPSLRKVAIADVTLVVSWFLSSLQLSDDAVSVSAIGLVPLVSHHSDAVHNTFLSLVPHNSRRHQLFPTALPRSGSVNADEDGVRLELSYSDTSELSFELRWEEPDLADVVDRDAVFIKALEEFCGPLFLGYPFQELSVYGNMGAITTRDQWYNFLAPYTEVRYLSVRGAGPVSPLFETLRFTREPPGNNANFDLDLPICPKLRRFRVLADHKEGDLALIVAMLECRALLNLPPVDELELHFPPEDQTYLNEKCRYEDRLNSLCSAVHYSGCE
ncbi:hypothetical protein C8Q78DRAFT_279791 [Trametes maxima]|nr:hypothetical protein C8Q78DRAFT_279791 [Trametes maxima]